MQSPPTVRSPNFGLRIWISTKSLVFLDRCIRRIVEVLVRQNSRFPAVEMQSEVAPGKTLKADLGG